MTRFKHEVWLWLLAALIGFAAFVTLYGKAFPTASSNLTITHAGAYSLAEEYMRGQGFTFDTYAHTATFDIASDAAVYLERNLGMERAYDIVREQDLPVWGWTVRWFHSQEVEEYRAWISPEGDFWGFHRTLAEDEAGANLEQEEAQRKAESFLRQAGVSMAELELVDSSTETHEDRTDHKFEWKRRDFDIGESQYRIAVEIQGDTVGLYEPYLDVPEDFEREFAGIQSQGILLSIISLLITIVLFAMALVVFVQRYKAGDLRWRFALIFAIVVVVVGIGSQLNTLPLIKAQYDTAIGYEIFMAGVVLGGIMLLALYGVFILLTGASGEALTRELRPESVQPLHDLVEGRLLTRRFAAAAGRGYLAAMVMLGYLTLFYLAGQKYLGVWTEPSHSYSNIFNTALPFLLPLSIGLMAAISEEFTYRLFAIPLIKKYLKHTTLALLIPALVWAFAHSSYPVFPIYVRGIELTIMGLFFGFLFLRYDIVT